MRALRRWLRPIKALAARAIEFRRGIMLGMPVAKGCKTMGRDLPQVSRVESLPRESYLGASKVLQRWHEGHYLYGIIEDGALLTHSWVSSAEAIVVVLHELVLKVPERSIYIWDGFTRVDRRNRGLHQHLLRSIVEQHPGIDTAYVAVDANNAASIRALTKVGFQPLFRYYGLKLLERPVLALARKGRNLVPAQRCFDRIAEDVRLLPRPWAFRSRANPSKSNRSRNPGDRLNP